MTIDPLRLLGANIRVAANLRYYDELLIKQRHSYNIVKMFYPRLEAIGCSIDDEYGYPTIRDRNYDPVSDGASDEPNQDEAVFELIVRHLEANGGIRK